MGTEEQEQEGVQPADPTASEQEISVQEHPDDDAGPAVEPTKGDQGEWVEQTPGSANPTVGGFDPDRPVATSPPPADMQSGVPQPTDGSNAGVEPNETYRGPVDPAQADASHAEANATDGDPEAEDED